MGFFSGLIHLSKKHHISLLVNNYIINVPIFTNVKVIFESQSEKNSLWVTHSHHILEKKVYLIDLPAYKHDVTKQRRKKLFSQREKKYNYEANG